MKTRHDGDCSVYASLGNYDMPEAGICTCGYAHEQQFQGNHNEMYSEELLAKLGIGRDRKKKE